MSARRLELLRQRIEGCRACPRLVAWREEVAAKKRRAFLGDRYWGKPVGGFGDDSARLALVGLAPAAHGANRTGRIFTGDRSGDFLFAALHRLGVANRAESVWRDDGLEVRGLWITAAVRCAPPNNKPTPDETARCAPFLHEELDLLPELRVIVALGAFAWTAVLRWIARRGSRASPVPAFGHGAVHRAADGPVVFGSYHVSQQNTQTGRLTPAMFDRVLTAALQESGLSAPHVSRAHPRESTSKVRL
jgi:uracil-DNA glycosylase family 4